MVDLPMKLSSWEQSHVDAAGVALVAIDRAGNITHANRLAVELLGGEKGRIIGKDWFELCVPEAQRAEALRVFHGAMAGEVAFLDLYEAPVVMHLPNGQVIAWRRFIIDGADGKAAGTLIVGDDISETKLAAESLRLLSEQQRALNELLRISLEDIPLQQQLQRALGTVLSLSWLPVLRKGGIFLVENGEPSLVLTAQEGLPAVLQTMCAHVPFGRCLCGRAAATGEVQYADCVDERHENRYDGITPHGHYNVPILSGGTLLGVMVLYLEEGHARSAREVDFLRSVANTLAGIILHRQARDELQASHAGLIEAQRIAHLGDWEWDIAKDCLRLSEEAGRILGASSDDGGCSRERFLAFVHPDDRQALAQAFGATVSESISRSVDCRIVRQDGSERISQVQMEASGDVAGRPARLKGTLQDITERMRTEAELRQSATVFENTTEGVLITDAATHIIAINRAFTEITGYGREELIGRTPAVLHSGRHDPAFYRAMWDALIKNSRWQGEIWNRRKNGEIYPEWLNISAVRDEHDRVTHYVGVFSDITALKESEAKLYRLAHHDPLTGLPNRLLLNARMEYALVRVRRSGKRLAVLFLDLDRFKYINDTLGHPAGDALLQQVAERIKSCVRDEDTVSRLGGDEFTVMLEELDDAGAASVVARKIIGALSTKFTLRGHAVFVTCSIGISLYPGDGEDVTTLFKNADSALYRAKEQGRDNYQFYTEDLTTRAVERLELENELRHALESREFVLYYQPQVDLKSGRTIGMEALVRWQHPQHGLILPGVFIPLAEETGLIIPLGEWVLRTACAQTKAWLDAGLPAVPVAVNLSPRQFREKNLAETVATVLRETALDPGYLELEITESLVMFDVEASIAVLRRLKDLGVRFSIDDFGTGYSSLSYLKRFPIDKIKIDQSFVRNVTTDPEDAAIVQAIISLSHSLTHKVIAEGVEEGAQLEFLNSLQCDEFQGYHFSHPIPADEMERLLRVHGDLQSGSS